MTAPKPGSIVLIEWLDAVTQHGWITPDEAKAWKPCPIQTVGFLVKRTRRRIVVMQSFNDEQVTGVFAIPADWVQKITVLEAP